MISLPVIVAISLLIAIFELPSVTAIDYRLSKDIFPLNYDITIKPYFLPEDGNKRFTFYGETTIIFNTRNSSIREFAVHADYLDFIEIKILTPNGMEMEFTRVYEERTDKLIFNTKEDLPAFENHTIKLKYTGRISDAFDGLYRMNYTDADGKEKWLVATQLQRIDARKLFPCFDEPGFKSFFTLHISRPRNFSAYSNTIILTTTFDDDDNDRLVDHFDTTPFMSTYLVAMMISEFIPRGQDHLFVIARPEYYNKTEFSYNVSRDVLSAFDKLFGIPYVALGNPILQKTCLPTFLYNGMENWGLMIYKEDVLIYDEGYTDLNDMEYTATVISHETSHNWFGNAITCEWWGYFWLNEGFARYYQYFGTHKIYPHYELDKQFTYNQLHYVLNIDAVNTTQPLSEPNVATPSEISKKFSSITYVKGSSVVRMISHAMSESHFENAIREYISKHIGKSVVPSDLFKYLKMYWPSSPRVDLDQFFYDWTEQVGYPLLIVTLANDSLSVKIEQKRFLSKPGDGSDPKLRYTIPLTYTTSIQRDFNNTYPIKYYYKDQDEISFKFAEPVKWVMFNIQQTSYYRVKYDTGLLYKLHYALYEENWSGIHELNRAQFIDDLFAFAKADLLDFELVFKWLEYLETETHYTPWVTAIDGFNFIGKCLTVEEHIDFGKYMLHITKKVFKNLGVVENTGESVLDKYNRKLIVNMNCKYGRDGCIEEVQTILRADLNNGTVIPVNIRSAIYCSGMRNASEEDFDKLLKRFQLEKVLREKKRMRQGLGCVRNSKNREKFFDLILSAEVPLIEKQETMRPLYEENPENVWPVYLMVTSRLEEVTKALDNSWSRAADMISSIAILFTTVEDRDAFEDFIKENRQKFGISSVILDDALQKLDVNLEWAENHLGPLRKYLKSRNHAIANSSINLFVFTLVILSYVLF